METHKLRGKGDSRPLTDSVSFGVDRRIHDPWSYGLFERTQMSSSLVYVS